MSTPEYVTNSLRSKSIITFPAITKKSDSTLLVALQDRKKSLNGKARKGSNVKITAAEQSDDEHSENETHFYNR